MYNGQNANLRKPPILRLSGTRLKEVGLLSTVYTDIEYKEFMNRYLLMNITKEDSEVFSKDKDIKAEQLLKM